MEEGHGVAGEQILTQDGYVPFKELVGLVAGQENWKEVLLMTTELHLQSF